MYIDFHTHLDCYKEEDLFSQLADFEGVLVSASMDAVSYARTCAIRDKAKALGYKAKILPTFGIHPAKVVEVLSQSADLSRFDELCKASSIIGEIGMDLCWYKDATVEQQEYVFRYFLNHCNQHKKYCVIHTKDAEQHIARILLDYPEARPIIHWYDGPEDIYREFISRGYYFTFGCETCRSAHIQKLLQMTPPERILAETDNPESEPWLGGTDNSLRLIERVYDDIVSLTFNNLLNENAFGIIKNI